MSIYEIKAFLKNTAAATDGDKIEFTRAWVESFVKGIDKHIEEVKSDKDKLYRIIEELKQDKTFLDEQLKVLEEVKIDKDKLDGVIEALESEKRELLYSREQLKAEMSDLNRENLNLKAQLNEKTNEDIKTTPTMTVSEILHLLYNLTVCRNDNDLDTISIGRLKNIRSSVERYYDAMEDRVRELKKQLDEANEKPSGISKDTVDRAIAAYKAKCDDFEREISDLVREKENLLKEFQDQHYEDYKALKEAEAELARFAAWIDNNTVPATKYNDEQQHWIKEVADLRIELLEREKQLDELKNGLSDYTIQRFNDLRMLNENQSKTIADLRREVERLSDPKNGFVEFVRKVIKEEEDSFTDRIRTRLKDEIDKVFNERFSDMRIDNTNK